MKKLLFAIFAHPDDEAFGPSGTLLLEARAGTEIHLITLTNGSGGSNPDNVADLGALRLEEWHHSAALIGAHATYHLGYTDGCLCNIDLPQIQQQLLDIVRSASEGADAIEFITMDDNGITGHIDHTIASRAATFAYYTLAASDLPVSRIRYACVSRETVPDVSVGWIYAPAGRTPGEIDETVDARDVLPEVIEIMRCHRSQAHDAEQHIALRGDRVAIDHFLVRST